MIFHIFLIVRTGIMIGAEVPPGETYTWSVILKTGGGWVLF